MVRFHPGAHMLTWIEVNATCLAHNLESFRKLLPHHTIIPVIKSNAYGASQSAILDTITKYCDTVSVVSTGEALALRPQLKTQRLLVLSIIDEDNIESAIQQGIELPLYNDHYLNLLTQAAKKLGKPALVHLKIDTGTHRLGYTKDQLPTVLENLEGNPHLKVVGLFSHFAASEELPDFTQVQEALFEEAIAQIKTVLKTQGFLIHMACSAAILAGEIPKSSTAVRLGLALYGYWPSELAHELAPKDITLEPILTWKTKIIHLNHYEAGESIGYGRSYVLDKPSVIATLPIGYYDGYDRDFSNRGEVLVGGKRCPVRGRVCMNLTMIDVTGITNAQIGDEVVLLGKQGAAEITAEDWASQLKTINYEIIARFNAEIPRVVVK